MMRRLIGVLALLLITPNASQADEGHGLDTSIFDPRSFGAQMTLAADRIVLCSGLEDFDVETIDRFLQSDIFEGRAITVSSGEDVGPLQKGTVWFLIDDQDFSPEVSACADKAGELGPELETALSDILSDGADASSLPSLNRFGLTPNLIRSKFAYGTDAAAIVTLSRLTGDALQSEALTISFWSTP